MYRTYRANKRMISKKFPCSTNEKFTHNESQSQKLSQQKPSQARRNGIERMMMTTTTTTRTNEGTSERTNERTKSAKEEQNIYYIHKRSIKCGSMFSYSNCLLTANFSTAYAFSVPLGIGAHLYTRTHTHSYALHPYSLFVRESFDR